jgi:NAD(P)-dependent dehydrogenase (short-subunit alcohol dehydrogenase family)
MFCMSLPCSAHDAYSLSKLCSIAFTLKLAELLRQRGSSVTVGALLAGDWWKSHYITEVHVLALPSALRVAPILLSDRLPVTWVLCAVVWQHVCIPEIRVTLLLLLLLLQVNTLDPGTVNTKMLLAGWGRIGIDVGSADNTFKLLTDPNVTDVTGGYFISHRKSR